MRPCVACHLSDRPTGLFVFRCTLQHHRSPTMPSPHLPQQTPPSQDIQLQANDGYRLAATLHPGRSDHWIVFGSATGVPRGFYRRFAEFAQGQGINVITTDYRGIGGSAPKRLRGFMPDYADWARQDLAAAVHYASQRGPSYLVGHSYAGHAIGLLPNHHMLKAAYVCAAGAGWHGWMPKAAQPKVWLMWNVIGPVTTPLLGYLPGKRMGLGEDLPVSVYQQWKRWCQFPHYFFDDPQAKDLVSGFAGVTLPIAAANALDDDWALPASRDAFFKGYPNAQLETINLTPASLGVDAVGHMGYYRAHVGRQLWPRMLGWLAQHGLPLSTA
jgi:predicted alpha/beta hydrolase